MKTKTKTVTIAASASTAPHENENENNHQSCLINRTNLRNVHFMGHSCKGLTGKPTFAPAGQWKQNWKEKEKLGSYGGCFHFHVLLRYLSHLCGLFTFSFSFVCGATVAVAVVVDIFSSCSAAVAVAVVVPDLIFIFIYLRSLGRLGSKRPLWTKWAGLGSKHSLAEKTRSNRKRKKTKTCLGLR